MFKITTVIFSLFIIITCFLPQLAFADGMLIESKYDHWDFQQESFQLAFINYEQGIEKMIISIGIDELTSNAVWIFPVPANPKDTVINVVNKLPQLYGQEITDMAKRSLDDIRMGLIATQFFPLPFFLVAMNPAGRILSDDSTAFQNLSDSSVQKLYDVEIYEHLEKEGITTEIITAKNANGLYQYLKDKNLDIKQGSIPVLDSYIGKDYAFVISWLTPSETAVIPTDNLLLEETTYEPATQKFQKGIFVAFPTDKIYYPLLPTSVYESEIVPAIIRVFGFVEPEIFSSIATYSKVEYYFEDNFSLDKDLEIFYRGPFENVKYTKIEMQAPSKILKNDLWIKDQAPSKTYLPLFLGRHPFITWILLFIVLSVVISILLGLIVYQESRKSLKGFLKIGLLGLFNCLTLIGLIFASIFIRFKDKKQEVADVLSQLKQKGYFWKRRLALILFLADIPFLVMIIFILPLIIFEFLFYLLGGYGLYRIDDDIFVSFFFTLLPIAVLIFLLILKRIKKDDKLLFEQLSQYDYSRWTFLPKDSRRLVFIPIFSIIFIIFSIAITFLFRGLL